MQIQLQKAAGIYEGTQPYLFISYSHRDKTALEQVKAIFEENGVRYWYDDGLHSGDDWNMMIATHLQNAAVCLLLLSPYAAESQYVKNELNFAMTHGIPIHTLVLSEFTLPPDIEMMTGRIQRIRMYGDYEKELLKTIPAQIFYASNAAADANAYKHPLFETCRELYERQGTTTYLGKHSVLQYPCTIQLDSVKASEKYEAQSMCVLAAGVCHTLFPKIYDVQLGNGQLWTYLEYRKETFLDRYLETNELTEETILNWAWAAADGMEYLYGRNLGLRDFARGSLVVVNDSSIGISRLQNLYYGLIRLQEETKAYYLDQELQELAILLAQLCTGKTPVLPLRMITEKRFSKQFLSVVNLVIQKCAKENGKSQYASFAQFKNDLRAAKLSFSDKKFLSEREKKLSRYDSARQERFDTFTATGADLPAAVPQHNLEKEFGFDETVVLGGGCNDIPSPLAEKPEAVIQLMICSTGQVMSFSKYDVRIGKDAACCDMVWTQPYVSRAHAWIRKLGGEGYLVSDLNSTNGTYVQREGQPECRVQPGTDVTVPAGTLIRIGESRFKIL